MNECIILCGKMASGKTTVSKGMQFLGYRRAVTDTTRKPRPGEKNGIDYNFVTDSEFAENLKSGLYAEDTSYEASYGHVCYASRKDSYTDSRTVIVLNPRGVRTIRKKGIPGTVVYLDASFDTMRKRLASRGDSQVEIDRRIVEDEPDFADILDYADIVIDVNGLDEEEVLMKTMRAIDKKRGGVFGGNVSV